MDTYVFFVTINSTCANLMKHFELLIGAYLALLTVLALMLEVSMFRTLNTTSCRRRLVST